MVDHQYVSELQSVAAPASDGNDGPRLSPIDNFLPAELAGTPDTDGAAVSDGHENGWRWIGQDAGSLYQFRVGATSASSPASRAAEESASAVAGSASPGNSAVSGTANSGALDAGTLAAGGGASNSSGSGTVGLSTMQIGSSGGLVFNISFDGSVGNAPAGFTAAINYVAQLFASSFNNPITINLDVGWGEIAGQSMGSGALGESETYLNTYSYSQVRSALAGHATSADQQAAVATLPSSSPAGSGSYSIATAEARALGLTAASGSLDGYVGFGSGYAYTFDPNNQAVSGEYDFIGVAAHEISEVMGRDSYIGEGLGYTALDLFRYLSPGVRQLSAARTAYFSLDGGNANLDNFNTVSGGDPGDWASSAGNDAFDAFSNSGVANTVGSTDMRELNVLGYSLPGSSSPNPAPTPAPTPTPTQGNPFDLNWRLAAVADFNGDGNADFAWQQTSNNQVELQLLSGTTTISASTIANSPFDSTWLVVAAGDFNGDGKADLMYRRSSDGLTAIQLLNGATGIGGGLIPNNPFGAGWNVVAAGDFNGDGKTDLAWQRSSDGLLEVQLLNGINPVGGGAVANNPFGLDWSVVAEGDFNGDHKADLVWCRNSDGLTAIQFLNGATGIGGGVMQNNPFGVGWTVVAAGDFSGDGKADLVWQRQSDGLVEIQYMNGLTPVGGGAIQNNPFGAGWQVSGAGGFNGAGQGDLVYRRASDGLTEIQFLKGTTPIGGGVTVGAAEPLLTATTNPLLHSPTILG